RGLPPELGERVWDGEPRYEGNAALALRLGGVTAALDTRWDLSQPAGGGDAYRSAIRGRRAEIAIAQDAATGFRRRLTVSPRGDAQAVGGAPARPIAGSQVQRPA